MFNWSVYPLISCTKSGPRPELEDSGTALQKDFEIDNVESKHLIMNIFAAVHCASYFSFAVIMSGINTTDHMSISAQWAHLCRLQQAAQQCTTSLFRVQKLGFRVQGLGFRALFFEV